MPATSPMKAQDQERSTTARLSRNASDPAPDRACLKCVASLKCHRWAITASAKMPNRPIVAPPLWPAPHPFAPSAHPLLSRDRKGALAEYPPPRQLFRVLV